MRCGSRVSRLAACVAVLSIGRAGGALAAPGGLAPYNLANRDTTCRPCDDFNRFANGGWIASHAIPASFPSWGRFDELREANEAALRTILERTTSAGSAST